MQTTPVVATAPIRLSQDSLGFVRRCCPLCARHFKVCAGKSEDLLVQSLFVGHLRHANAEEVRGLPQRYCPYCAHGAPADAFLTGQQRSYIEGWARALGGELRYEQLRQVERHLDDNPYVTFVPVAPKEQGPVLPPEPDDMQPALLLCCGEELKLKATWVDAFYCHHCRAKHRGDGT